MSLASEGYKSGTLEYQREWHRRNREKYKLVRQQYYEANKEKVNSDSKARYTAKKFGLSVEEYDTWRESKDSCECCGTPLELRWRQLDHCHTTGEVRGILCHSCNMGLGLFKDNPLLLEAAINYLRTHAGKV